MTKLCPKHGGSWGSEQCEVCLRDAPKDMQIGMIEVPTSPEPQKYPGVPTGYVPRRSPNTPEPAPKPTAHPAVWSLVIADMAERDAIGLGKYGQRLQPFNGRDPLRDAYQEVLDLAVYLRQEIYEREMGKRNG